MKELREILINWLFSDGYTKETAIKQIKNATIIIRNKTIIIIYENGITDCIEINEEGIIVKLF